MLHVADAMDVGAENKRMFEPPSPASRRFAAPETKRRFVPAESTSRAARLSDGDNDMAAALAQRGFVAVSINYRLAIRRLADQ